MRITIVQGAFLPVPPLMGGAVEKVWFALGKEFARRGHRVTHISRAVPQLPQRETIDGVDHQRVKGFNQPRSLVRLKLLDLVYSMRVRRILPAADILVTNTFWLPLLVRSARFGLVYVHVQRTPKGQMRWYAHAARLLAVSRAIADAIIAEAPQLQDKVRVIPNALPFGIANATNMQRSKTLLFVGRIHPEKGLELLLRAAADLPPDVRSWTLKIVGPHEPRHGGAGEEFLGELRRLAERSVLQVQWMGPVFDQAELVRLYASTGAFVYPSGSDAGEALPVAPLEAMANACPPIVSALACFDDYVQDGVNGFVFDNRGANAQKNLTACLAKVLQMDPAELANVGVAAHESVKQFAVEPVANRYLADFETLLQTHNG